MWKKIVVADFKALYQHFPWGVQRENATNLYHINPSGRKWNRHTPNNKNWQPLNRKVPSLYLNNSNLSLTFFNYVCMLFYIECDNDKTWHNQCLKTFHYACTLSVLTGRKALNFCCIILALCTTCFTGLQLQQLLEPDNLRSRFKHFQILNNSRYILFYALYTHIRRHAVAQLVAALCYKPHCGPGVDSASNRNAYLEFSWR
jgi:hypothetical protein